MRILAHRGDWRTAAEKNTIAALTRALEQGFGIETDLRDYQGKLVISHNPADAASPLAEQFFAAYASGGYRLPLALNVKADGIQRLLAEELGRYGITEYFLFDMSAPEMVVYRDQGFRYYSRESDIEPQNVLYEDASGVWIDTFYDFSWDAIAASERHLRQGKHVCLVSPELHGKEKALFWERLKKASFVSNGALCLCTDAPQEARTFFEGASS